MIKPRITIRKRRGRYWYAVVNSNSTGSNGVYWELSDMPWFLRYLRQIKAL